MKNRWKLTALLMAALVCIAAVCPAALAAGKEYSFAEQGIRFTLPEDLRVLEYPVEDGDPLIPLTGYFTADDLNQYYEQTGTLLEAYFPDSGAFLSVEAWQDEESQAIGSYAAESENELQERIADYPYDWESDPPGRSTATVETLAGQPFLLFSDEMGENTISRYYETIYGGSWIYLSLYPAQTGDSLREEELSALGSLAESISFSTDPAAAVENSASSDWMETVSLMLFSLGLLLFVLLVIFLARSIRRSQPLPTVLPGFACRVSTPVGPADFYPQYFVVFPTGGQPLSFRYEQTRGIVETEDCFWIYPPNLPPLPLAKNAFLAGSPKRFGLLLSQWIQPAPQAQADAAQSQTDAAAPEAAHNQDTNTPQI